MTDSFYSITPETVLKSVESIGFVCTGRCLAMNSYENRVYDVELDFSDDGTAAPLNKSERFRVVKFYRPGRWTLEQIQEEHAFLYELHDADIPVITPLKNEQAQSVFTTEEGIYFTLFPKVGGRSVEEPNEDQFKQLGRLIARIHAVGRSKQFVHRLTLSPRSYGTDALEVLEKGNWINHLYKQRYLEAGRKIVDLIQPLFKTHDSTNIRVHGDCHYGNILMQGEKLSFVDFDDCIMAPPVQDLWLLIQEENFEHSNQWHDLLDGYHQISDLPKKSASLVEPLRALRMMHYAAWLAKRWADPAFPKAFPNFGQDKYWEGQTRDLELQAMKIEQNLNSSTFHPNSYLV